MDGTVTEPERVSGRWVKGSSGNRGGRPTGDYATLVRKLREHNFQFVQEQMDNLRARGNAGEWKCSIAWLEFEIGRAKSVEVATRLPFDGTVAGVQEAVFVALAEGRVSWEVAAKLLGSLTGHLEVPLLELTKQVKAAVGG